MRNSRHQTRRDLLRLFLLSLGIRLAVAALIQRPGYMDAAYYAAGAVRLAQGGGLCEQFLWNYLDDPAGIPHPAFLYWMPLPSLLAAPFAALFPGSFFAIQLPFAFISALLPLVAYGLAWESTSQRRIAWLAGLITLFSGYFFPHWTLPETFAPFALFGSVALWLAGRWGKGKRWILDVGYWLLIGLLVGLMHLTRADGILLLPVVSLAPFLSSLSCRSPSRNTEHAPRFVIIAVIAGYLLVMAPWFARNLSVVGAPLPPGGTRTLWLTTYDDILCYRCELSPRMYLAWGWGQILTSKLSALWINFQRLLAEDCLIFLFPFAIIGLWRLRRRSSFFLSLIYLLLVYLAHSLAFTFPGPRGGFFHASVAMLPFLFAAGAEGLDTTIRWVGRQRRWNLQQARVVFTGAAVVAAVVLSGYVSMEKLLAWRDADAAYIEVGHWLALEGVEEATVMVGNPPAFWYHTGRPAVVVPNGDVETLLAVADRYGASYVTLDWNRPGELAGLYAGDEHQPRLRPVAVWGEGVDRVVLYRLYAAEH
ncbi:MAG: glycosyltransferase family 39 protein [Chloroflexota bacterium]|nr:glycosyltransferase family 39 protein [Chloroflexota bacterium]